MNRQKYVESFYAAADKKTDKDGGDFAPVFTCFAEELGEFNEALAAFALDVDNPELRKEMIKEWADVAYTLEAFAWFFDFDGEDAYVRVAENNLTKVSADGKIRYRSDGKIMKPDGYKKPDMGGL